MLGCAYAASSFVQSYTLNPPAIAASRGITSLLLYESFTDASRFGFDGSLTRDQTFCQTAPGNIYNCSLDDPSGFVFTSDGLTIQNQLHSDYQAHIISYDPFNKRGFLLPKGGGWYVELNVKLLSSWVGWPGGFAFWSLDHRHPYAGYLSPDQQLDEPSILEPDFHEIGASETSPGVWERKEWLALHNWVNTGGGVEYQPSQRVIGNLRVDAQQWFKCGALVEGNLSAYRWHVNGAIVASCTPAWLTKFKTWQGPIIIGCGPNNPIQIRNLQVWGQPN